MQSSHSYNDLLMQILHIIRIGDKEKFVKNFNDMNHAEAMRNCVERLPLHIQKAIAEKISDVEFIKKYIPQEVYKEEFDKVSSHAFLDFLEHMTPAIDEQQEQQITALIASY